MKIITDSAADITAQQAENMKIEIVPIRIQFGTRECPMDTEEDFDDFFRQLQQSRELPKTSQPSPREYLRLFSEAQQADEEVLVITLSSGLSGTINAAQLARSISGYEKYGFLIPSRRLPPSVIWWSVRRLCGMKGRTRRRLQNIFPICGGR